MRVKAAVPGYRRWSWALAVVLFASVATAFAADAEFPFDQELLLDAAPAPGSKRVPALEVQSNGSATIDLWCANVRGRVHVEGSAISIIPQSADRGTCTEEHLKQDAEMLTVLTQVTTWRREGNAVVLVGPQTLRYRVSSH
jgi:heat shock protein HslJ